MICTKCNEDKDPKEFYPRHFYCKACFLANQKVKRDQRRVDWITWIADKRVACEICGYDKCMAALEFHHTDPSSKELSIGRWTCGAYAFTVKNKTIVLNEIKKCIVLCANCHRELHASE